MRQLLQAIVLIITFAWLRSSFSNTIAGTFFQVLFIGSIVYLVIAIIKIINAPGNNVSGRQVANTTQVINKMGHQQHSRRIINNYGMWFIGMAALGLLIYFNQKWLSQKSFRSLLFVDNLLEVDSSVPPVIMWGVLGMFIGLMYGGIIAYKKYTLTPKVALLPAAATLFFIGTMFIMNQPLNSKSIIVYETRRQAAYGFVSVRATNLRPAATATYLTTNLIDQDDHTAWASDYSHTKKQVVMFTFNGLPAGDTREIKFVGIRIKNGYRKTRETWENFCRLKQFDILLNGGAVSGLPVSANDEIRRSQDIITPALPLRQNDVISIVMLSIYLGKNLPPQVAISELIPLIEYEGR